MLKRTLSLILAYMLAASFAISAFAAGDVKITYMGYGEKNKKTHVAYVIPDAIYKGSYVVYNNQDIYDYASKYGIAHFPVGTDSASADFKGHKVPAYSIKSGTKIDISNRIQHTFVLKDTRGNLVTSLLPSRWYDLITITGERQPGDGRYVQAESRPYKKGSTIQFNEPGKYLFVAYDPSIGQSQDEPYCFAILIVEASSVSKPAEDKPFSLEALKKALPSRSDYKVYDTTLTTLNTQLSRLNRDIAAGKRIENQSDVISTLHEVHSYVDTVAYRMVNNHSGLKLYAKKGSAQKKTKAEIAVTEKKLDAIYKNLQKAAQHYNISYDVIDG